MRRLVLVITLVSVAWGMPAGRAAEQPDAATGIRMHVVVRERSRAVAGLTAADFTVIDNGVAQKVELVPVERVPLDVTVVFDPRGSAANTVERITSDLQQIERLLRAGDRLRVLRVDTSVEEVRPMSAIGTQAAASWTPRAPGLAALHDALIAALMRPNPQGREQLIVTLTDGSDTGSTTTADRVREVAARSDARLHVVTVRPAGTRAVPSMVRPRFRDGSLLILAEAADQTGGELREPGLFGDPDLVSGFTRAFDEFRQGYVLQYVPAHVEREGWHDVSIVVPRAPDATIRSRRGYYAN